MARPPTQIWRETDAAHERRARNRAARRPDLPQPGETFAQYTRRSESTAPLRDFSESRGLRDPSARRGQVLVDPRESAAVARQERRERDRAMRRAYAAQGLNRILGEGMVERHNEPTMDIESIALGQMAPDIQNRGTPQARTYSMSASGRPLGLIMWGRDMRRHPQEIADDIGRATGVSGSFLYVLGQRESGWKTSARASTSSATGAFQFIDSTWRETVARHGERYGRVAGMHDEDVLALREDPRWSGAMAAELARENTAYFRQNVGRAPTERELYFMHFAGNARGAAAATAPANADPKTVFSSQQIGANRPVFYNESGGMRTMGEVRERLGRGFTDRPAAIGPRADGSVN